MSSAAPPPAEDTPGANQPAADQAANQVGNPAAAQAAARAGDDESKNGIRPNAWNLLLLIPLLMLVTPWFNHDGPRFIGIPFFYWFQFLFVPVGVICVWVVHVMTRTEPVRTDKPDLLAAQNVGAHDLGAQQPEAQPLDEGDAK